MTTSTRKLREKSDKVYRDDGLADDDIEGTRSFDVQEKVDSDAYNADLVLEMSGEEVSVAHFQRSGHKYPLVIHERAGLGLRTPSSSFTVSDVKKCVGSRRMLDVMDVETQKGLEMSLKDWEQYYENPVRERLLNVISLEFSHTRLDQYVDAPSVVQHVDFINNSWPKHLKEFQCDSTNVLEKMFYPKVQKYCLMSVGNCYTDFHVDFGGTSVWYHILRGQKVFWLIEPTDENLDLYAEWVLSGKQGDVFFGDKVKQCQRIDLHEGDTFFIPAGWTHGVFTPVDSLIFGDNFLHNYCTVAFKLSTGWIHGVFTPVDSLVFGGNFLHSYNLTEQLKVANIEDRTKVPAKFRFPFFTEMMWYVLAQYVRCLMGYNHYIPPPPDDDDEGTAKMKTEVTMEKIKGEHIHLTPCELQGIRDVVEWLENLPTTKKSIPRDLLDVDDLLERTKDMLKAHKHDDPDLAITGVMPISWPPDPKKQKKPRAFKPGTKDKDKPPKVINVNRRRRTRCKRCEACRRDDCHECVYCHDMKKFGGPGRMKQSCKSRQCMAPSLPANANCFICGESTSEGDIDDDIGCEMMILECGICWDITHPACLREKYPDLGEGVLNDALPNSWQCIKCCGEGKLGQLKARVWPKGGGPTQVNSVKLEKSDSILDADDEMDDEIEEQKDSSLVKEEDISMNDDCIERLVADDTVDENDMDDDDDASDISGPSAPNDILMLLEHTKTATLDHPYTKSDEECSPRRPLSKTPDHDGYASVRTVTSSTNDVQIITTIVKRPVAENSTARRKVDLNSIENRATVSPNVLNDLNKNRNIFGKLKSMVAAKKDDSNLSKREEKLQKSATKKDVKSVTKVTEKKLTLKSDDKHPIERLKSDDDSTKVDSSGDKKRPYKRKSVTMIHEGKRVTMHGKRVLDDTGAEINADELDDTKSTKTDDTKRLSEHDIMPILERISCGSEDEMSSPTSKSKKHVPLKLQKPPSLKPMFKTSKSPKTPPVPKVVITPPKKFTGGTKSSSESESDTGSKRPRREVFVPKRFLE